jgi:diguanylate cyclase (GGDEF)-like protein
VHRRALRSGPGAVGSAPRAAATSRPARARRARPADTPRSITPGLPARRYIRGALYDLTPIGASSVRELLDDIPDGIWIALAALILLTACLAIALALAAVRLRREAARADALAGLARTDALTGLLNRRGMDERVHAELQRAKRYGYGLAVIYGDMRGLKAINDKHGHEAGDRLLKTTAKILEHEIREGDSCGRIGGDEFAVILIHQGREGGEAFCERVRKKLRASSIPGHLLDVTMGIATFPEDGDDVDELYRVADRRLYAQRGISV